MSTIIDSIMSGVVATVAMTLFLWLLHYTKVVNADMPRAIGGIFTRSSDNALVVGTVLHFLAGIVFGFVYIVIWSLFALDTKLLLFSGAILGAGHGLVVSFALIIFIAERHPLEQFQSAGFEVAVAHLVAHIIYGVVLAAMVASTGVAIPLSMG